MGTKTISIISSISFIALSFILSANSNKTLANSKEVVDELKVHFSNNSLITKAEIKSVEISPAELQRISKKILEKSSNFKALKNYKFMKAAIDLCRAHAFKNYVSNSGRKSNQKPLLHWILINSRSKDLYLIFSKALYQYNLTSNSFKSVSLSKEDLENYTEAAIKNGYSCISPPPRSSGQFYKDMKNGLIKSIKLTDIAELEKIIQMCQEEIKVRDAITLPSPLMIRGAFSHNINNEIIFEFEHQYIDYFLMQYHYYSYDKKSKSLKYYFIGNLLKTLRGRSF